MKYFFRDGRRLPFGQSDTVTQLRSDKHLSNRPIEQIKYRLLRFARKDGTQRTEVRSVWLMPFAKGYLLSAFVIIFCVLFSVTAAIPAFGQEADGLNKVQPLLVGQQLPNEFWNRDYLIYKDGDTTRQKLDIHKRKLIVLDFWATWCAICLGRMKKTDSLFAKYPDDAQLIYVNPTQTKDNYDKILKIQDRLSEASLTGSFTSIIEDDYLNELFPNSIYPRYAWIGPYGNLIALTTSLSVTDVHVSHILKIFKKKSDAK